MSDGSWGKTTDFALEPPAPGSDGGWSRPDWTDVVFPDQQGELRHGSTGSRLPDAVVVRLEGKPVAIADAYHHTLENQYCWDCEYYLVLRLREILAPALWRTLPWAHLEAGDVFFAWDKFHWQTYSRTADDGGAMSYGDWADLQAVIDAEHPRPEGPRPAGPPSDATLLRAVRAGDLEQVRALLTAGAVVDRAPPGGMTPLHGALANRKLAVVPVLLRFGADPDATWEGRTAREVADSIGPSAAALLARPPRGG